MKNMAQMLKQAQQMQAKMAELQEQLDQIEITGAAAGGMVKVTLAGKGELRRIKIDKSLVDPAEVEMLEDLILAAFNDAKTHLDTRVAEEMSKLTGGLKLPPGMKMPF
jgi:DNA-binding YbaB/EbfC family protein